MSSEKQPTTSDSADASALAQRVNQWVNSNEGGAKLLQTQQSVRVAVESSQNYSQVEPELLRKPVTL